MTEELPDKYCQRIFTLLMTSDKKLRFNELHRALIAFEAKMSKPTLIIHLQHLQERGLVLRVEEDKQNVTYQANWDRMNKVLKKGLDLRQVINRQIENEKRFKSESLEDQVIHVALILSMEQLLHLQLYALDVLEPQGKPEHRFGQIFTHKIFDVYRAWLVDTFRESKETAEKAMNILQKMIEAYQNALFEKPSKTTPEKLNNLAHAIREM